MIRISQFKLPLGKEAMFEAQLRKELMISDLHPMSYEIIRRSLDARMRHGEGLSYVYTVDVTLAKEDKVFKRGTYARKQWEFFDKKPVYVPPVLTRQVDERPVIIGMGPAGLFCALLLARTGLKPLIIERGQPVEQRRLDTQVFFTRRQLDPESNVQFGEGGAGTFSDGKLNTLIKDPSQRGHFVFTEMVKAGAPEEILYDAKPHVGTDRLQVVVKNIRDELLSLGAEIRFGTKLTNIRTEDGRITAIEVTAVTGANALTHADAVVSEWIPCEALFLGIGHSARDTFQMLAASGVIMEEKPFAMGLRIEHPRTMIDQSQYGSFAGHPSLSAASYKLTHTAQNGRHVYTFCMCPGGKVIASSSELGGVVVNGMSNYARDEENSNSALLVNVTPEDFVPYKEAALQVFGTEKLSGALFQRTLEQAAFRLGGSTYAAPIQTVGDFLNNKESSLSSFTDVQPSFTGLVAPSNLQEILPDYMTEALKDALPAFGHKLQGFDRPDAVLTGVESRSSSPIRILRDETGQSNIRGLYPMGEGAGYAGGITSAAIDGIKMAELFLKA